MTYFAQTVPLISFVIGSKYFGGVIVISNFGKTAMTGKKRMTVEDISTS
jgi:hypothetical protein